ncbi:MAG TPA: tRNA (adenosine(37)-N6)-threonylcarbamoyltransferase complex dimerization subunit type 1 TsaB [Hyphomicrobiaceae bacterium]|nr:tRNA (adenosine(37)-N6)-threonylcarbamoyltransferase complex dimerization subunit type 1 TsaB [Hyphomicrobiaceae bacterium]
MRILAFDTSFDAVSAAAGVREESGTWRVSERFEAIGKGHAEKLLPMVREVMAEAGLDYAHLDRIAVTNGPGGFTGLRAGLAAARGLALAAGKPLVAVGSLELLALSFAARREAVTSHDDAPLVIAMDARKGEVFVQIFHSPRRVEATGRAALVGVGEVVGMLPAGPVTIAGSGADAVADAAGRREGLRVVTALSAHARDLIGVAERLAPTGPVAPIYIRPPDAKPQMSASIARSAS